jgi:AraC family transcriptional regulator
MLVAGIRRRHPLSDVAARIPAQWREFTALPPIPGRIGSGRLGVMCGVWDGEFEYMTGVEVESFELLPEGMGRMRIPAQSYVVFTHVGPLSGLSASWRWIWEEWLPGSGMTPADTPDFEVYGEGFDPDTGSGLVEIWFPVVAPEGRTESAPGSGAGG